MTWPLSTPSVSFFFFLNLCYSQTQQLTALLVYRPALIGFYLQENISIFPSLPPCPFSLLTHILTLGSHPFPLLCKSFPHF